jgi:hypothetical protein
MLRSLPLAACAVLLWAQSAFGQPATQPARPGPATQPADDEEVEIEEGGPVAQGELDIDKAPFTDAQKKFLKAWGEQIRARATAAGAPPAAPPRFALGWRVETYTKILYQNDQSQGSVSYGTPHPRGDNYTGNNGFASELNLYLEGRVSDKVEAGARIASRFHRQWGDFYENGDLARDPAGLPSGADSTGESLGMNHAAYLQLRGLYLRVSPPIPSVRTFHVGSSDLGQFNAWTVGKTRYIDRDNANGLFLEGEAWTIGYTLTRISLPKLYASAGWNSGIDDPLIQNPFWTRDAVYALKLTQQPRDWLTWSFITSYLLDEEADLNDPDTLGSTNFIDRKDGVVATLPRYQNLNSTLEVQVNRKWLDANLLVGFSRSDPSLDYVFNSVDGNQGISPIPMATVNSYAVKARADLVNLWGGGLDIRLEYFNIGENWMSTFGARREADVLLTDGFLDGQLPTLNIANEFIDFRDPFYESIIGWHGVTLSPRYARGAFELDLEFTFLEYNTDKQNRCTGNAITDKDGNPIASQVCPQDPETGKYYGVYPSFLFPDGMTDTEFYSYANTNDRGRDPRAVYRQNQARRTLISMARLGYQIPVGRGLRWDLKVKYIRDTDLRNLEVVDDDYAGNLLFGRTAFGYQVTTELSASLGVKLAWWDEKHRSGAVVAGRPDYPDYRTWKTNFFYELRYQIGGATLAWYMEWLNKDVEVSRAGVRDERQSFAFKNVLRGMGTVSAAF